jgi:hypothetical protein
MRLEKNHMIVIGIVAVLLCAGAGAYLLTRDNSDGDALVFAAGNKDCYEPAWIADQKGLYAKYGANVETLTVSGGGKGLEAMLAGQADFASFGSTPIINLLNNPHSNDYVLLARYLTGPSHAEMASMVRDEGGVKHVYSLYYPHGSGGSLVTVTTKDGPVQAIADPLKGITIGMDTSTAYLAALRNYCDAVGLTCAMEGVATGDDIKIRHREFSVQIASLINTKDIDGLLGGSYSIASYYLDSVVLSTPNVDEFPALETDAPVILAVSREVYVNRYSDVVAVLKALQEACCYIYGIDSTTELLTPEYVKAKQAAKIATMTPQEVEDLYGTTTASKKGYYYTSDACNIVASVFGYPFDENVQRHSFDSYEWGLNFELIDMKIIRNAYDSAKKNAAAGVYRDVPTMDYMKYFDGSALYDALKKNTTESYWESDEWFMNSSIYFCTTKTITLDEAASSDEVAMIFTDVVDGLWEIWFLNEHGKSVDGLTITLKMGANTITMGNGWTYASNVLILQLALSDNVVVTATK